MRGVSRCLWVFLRQHHAVILRALKTRDSHLRKGPRQRCLQRGGKLSSSHPARSQLEQLTADVPPHTHRELLETEDPQAASACVKSRQQLLLLVPQTMKDSSWWLFCLHSRCRLCCKELGAHLQTGQWGVCLPSHYKRFFPCNDGKGWNDFFGFKSNCGLVNPDGASWELTHGTMSEPRVCAGSEAKRSQGGNTHPARVR